MDARIDTGKSLGISEGEAHVIRNAGGRAHDALRSVIISQQLLGTQEVVIVHHVCIPPQALKLILTHQQTDCGMLTFTDEVLRKKIRDGLGEDVDHVSFLPFPDLQESVRDDVALLRKSPLVLDVPITGYIYDVKTGRIERVE